MATSSSDKPRNWSELPSELVSSIMLRLGVVEILENAQKVCSSWQRVSKDPSIWRKIDMRDLVGIEDKFNRICRQSVDRSDGSLTEINLGNFADDSLLNYVADRSSNLRSLTFDLYFLNLKNVRLENAFVKLQLLEELEVSGIISYESNLNLKAIGHSCPRLKTLKLYYDDILFYGNKRDDDALEIAESMPELRHLQIHGNGLTETGLNAILDSCLHLEHLELRNCVHVNLVGDLEKRCLERIEVFRRSNDHPIFSTIIEDIAGLDFSIEDDDFDYFSFL